MIICTILLHMSVLISNYNTAVRKLDDYEVEIKKTDIKINIDSKQLGKKWGKHKFDYPNLNSFDEYKNLIDEVFNNPNKIVYDSVKKEYSYIKGDNLLRIEVNGNFISLYQGVESERVINAIERGGTIWEKY